jgi:hypothetical protein
MDSELDSELDYKSIDQYFTNDYDPDDNDDVIHYFDGGQYEIFNKTLKIKVIFDTSNSSFLELIKDCDTLFIDIPMKLDWVPQNIIFISINFSNNNDEFVQISPSFTFQIEDLHNKVIFLSIYTYPNFIQKFPSNLQVLHIDDNYIHPLDNLPSNLKILRFTPNKHHQSPYTDEDLIKYFPYPLDNLPDSLEIIEYPNNFNHQIEYLPDNVKEVILKGYGVNGFHQKLDLLPKNIKKLTLDVSNYNLDLTNLPDSIEELYLHGELFKSELNIPSNLKKLTVYGIECSYKDENIIIKYILNKFKNKINTHQFIFKIDEIDLTSQTHTVDEILDIYHEYHSDEDSNDEYSDFQDDEDNDNDNDNNDNDNQDNDNQDNDNNDNDNLDNDNNDNLDNYNQDNDNQDNDNNDNDNNDNDNNDNDNDNQDNDNQDNDNNDNDNLDNDNNDNDNQDNDNLDNDNNDNDNQDNDNNDNDNKDSQLKKRSIDEFDNNTDKLSKKHKESVQIIKGYNMLTDSWHCLECGIDMGRHNPRQLCGKIYCENS